LAALGVVYGDIGTSPLYALKEIFAGSHLAVEPGNEFGILSLVFWTLTIIVSPKYVSLILRADNNGEGGFIAMLALATNARRPTTSGCANCCSCLGFSGQRYFR
jgi:KUP system potassium uptake protein